MTGAPDGDLARLAWRGLTEVALDRGRKVAVSDALGLSWTRVLVLRLLTRQPHTLRMLAEHLSADPPYVTLMVNDLEKRGLVRRLPHPEDGRAKMVDLTTSGRTAAERAAAIIDEPPSVLRDVAPDDLEAVIRVLRRLAH